MKISIGVTTHNRAASLERLMASFLKLDMSDTGPVEFVVVANACTDNTLGVLEKYRQKLPLKIVTESRLGISHGRNAVVKNATGDALLWTDDDNTVGPDWAAEYFRLFESHEHVDFFGGPIEPVFEGKSQPPWLTAVLRHAPSTYAIINLGPEMRPYDVKHWEAPYGANMAMRTRVLAKDPFNVGQGRVGHDHLSGAEETQLFRNLQFAGHVGFWTPSPVVQHWIDEGRQTLRHLKSQYWHNGQDEFAIMPQEAREYRFAASPWQRRRRLFDLWVTYHLARIRADPDQWIPALREYHLERGRMRYMNTHQNPGRSREKTSGKQIN